MTSRSLYGCLLRCCWHVHHGLGRQPDLPQGLIGRRSAVAAMTFKWAFIKRPGTMTYPVGGTLVLMPAIATIQSLLAHDRLHFTISQADFKTSCLWQLVFKEHWSKEDEMRKLIVWNLMTLDGYFEGTKPWDIEFHNLAWGPELEKYAEQFGEEGDSVGLRPQDL